MADDPAFVVTVDGDKRLVMAFERLGRAAPEIRQKALLKGALMVQREVRQQLTSGARYGPGKPNLTDRLGVGSGKYRQSIAIYPSRPTDFVLIGTNAVQRIHEVGTVGKGGTRPDIVPKRARALAIPLTAQAARVGPREMTGLFLLPSDGAKPDQVGVLMQQSGTRLVPMYLLKKRVALRPRPHFRPAYEKTKPGIEAEFDKMLNAEIAKA